MKNSETGKTIRLNGKLSRRWISFFLAVAMVVIFMFIIAPGLLRITGVKKMAMCIEESNIEASALWWSEVELVADAEISCRNSINYSPIK